MTKQELIDFETEIHDAFLAGQIKAPVHLSKGNEDALIEIFKQIKEEDWVFSTHRSHYHALLKGVDREWLRKEILSGRSMHINFDKFMTSSIVSGCVPIAVGVAMAVKRKRCKNWVWCFVGDMASTIGTFYECTKYSAMNDLPITFIEEDNGMSTNTPTLLAWGMGLKSPHIKRYTYKREMPHINCGKFVTFG
ncbi:hypothetical protein LCGC14_1195590 [marine sediment metagenome]|uniref:Dehydrogenase E1 component domain-containing protein n=1 Tax=marine sediment metagenome TaxID=412755 RepID=A0A0F9LIJ2_9ZZZZ